MPDTSNSRPTESQIQKFVEEELQNSAHPQQQEWVDVTAQLSLQDKDNNATEGTQQEGLLIQKGLEALGMGVQKDESGSLKADQLDLATLMTLSDRLNTDPYKLIISAGEHAVEFEEKNEALDKLANDLDTVVARIIASMAIRKAVKNKQQAKNS